MDIILNSVPIILICSLSVSSGFKVNVQDNGQYSVSVGGKVWLSSGPTFFNKDGVSWSVADHNNTLTLKNVTHASSGGYVTNWRETQFTYTYGNGSDTVKTGIRTFTESDTAIFSQTYMSACNDTSVRDGQFLAETISGFPTFQVADPDEPLGYLHFHGNNLDDWRKAIKRFNHTTKLLDGYAAGPLAIFNEKGQTIVISPYDNFMAASMWQVGTPGGHLAWGIMGGVNNVPANFTYRTIIRFADSINEAFTLWGESLASRFPAIYDADSKAGNQSHDISLHKLGYWTQKGSYYFNNQEQNKTYEQTLMDIIADAQNKSIPYKYLQLDSWWYAKDSYDSVTSWTPLPAKLPNGLKSLGDTLQMNFVAQNGIWSSKTNYSNKYNWITDRTTSLPNDIDFWRFLFRQAKAWGILVYEQDGMVWQASTKELQTSLTLGRDWLTQMGAAAAEQGVVIQYCNALPRQVLQSLEIPTVTQARVSYDAMDGFGMWQIGVTSILADALGLIPHKGTFWTSPGEPGNPYDPSEVGHLQPDLEAAVASLSTGPVGPGDGIGYTNTSMLMRCCRQDGTLLKPSKPIKALDKQIITEAFHPSKTKSAMSQVWGTYTDVYVAVNRTMTFRYGVLLATSVNQPMTVTIADFWFDLDSDKMPKRPNSMFHKFPDKRQEAAVYLPERGVYWPYTSPGQWRYYNSSTTLDLRACTLANFCLYHFAPLLPGRSPISAVLGDPSKWVPMAPQRMKIVNVYDDYVSVTVVGSPGEHVPVSFLLNDQPWMTNCIIQSGKTQQVCDLIWNPDGTTSPTSRASRGTTVPTSRGTSNQKSRALCVTNLLIVVTAVFVSTWGS